jgi:hypothetical protein
MGTDLELHAQHHIGLILQSCSSLTACDLVSHDDWQKRRGDLRRSRSQAAKRERAFVCQRH